MRERLFDLAVILERLKGRLGKGRDRIGADQLLDVADVAVSRILRRRRCPERPLREGATPAKRLSARAAERSLEVTVSQLCARDSQLTAQHERLVASVLRQEL